MNKLNCNCNSIRCRHLHPPPPTSSCHLKFVQKILKISEKGHGHFLCQPNDNPTINASKQTCIYFECQWNNFDLEGHETWQFIAPFLPARHNTPQVQICQLRCHILHVTLRSRLMQKSEHQGVKHHGAQTAHEGVNNLNETNGCTIAKRFLLETRLEDMVCSVHSLLSHLLTLKNKFGWNHVTKIDRHGTSMFTAETTTDQPMQHATTPSKSSQTKQYRFATESL